MVQQETQDSSDRKNLQDCIERLKSLISIEFVKGFENFEHELGHVIQAHSDFLANLSLIKENLNSSSYTVNDVQDALEKAASHYLLTLGNLQNKSTSTKASTYIFTHFNKLEVGIGKALLKIENIQRKQQLPSTKWFVGFARRLRQRVLGLSQRKRLLISHAKLQGKLSAKRTEQEPIVAVQPSVTEAPKPISPKR